jgi:hypothetical protein
MPEQYPADQYGPAVDGQMVQWRTDRGAEFGYYTPDTLFEWDGRIYERTDVGPFEESIQLNRRPIVEGLDWGEVAAREHGFHALQAVVNARGRNFGVATTAVDERQVTYITELGEEPQSGVLLGIMNDNVEGGMSFTIFSSDEPESCEALFTVLRTQDGELYVTNDSEEPLRIGLGREIEPPRRSFRERFSFRNIFNGLRSAVAAEREARYRNRNLLSGSMGWMVSAGEVPAWTRFMRNRDCDWVTPEPIEQYS